MQDHPELEAGLAEYLYEREQEEYKSRTFPIIDTSTNTSGALSCLKGKGVDTIIRYYCRDPKGAWKIIRRPEAEKITDNGMNLCAVYEVSAKANYFSEASGLLDGKYACTYATKVIGQPKGSAIYFAIDFDATIQEIKDRVIPYFKGITQEVTKAGSPYRIGVYGSGLTCKRLLDLGLVEFAWLAQSTDWAGYKSFKASNQWALLQKPTVETCDIEVDFDEASVEDFGAFSKLNAVKAEDAEDLELSYGTFSALDGLDAGFKAKLQLLIQTCAAKKIKMVPYFGLRSPAEQAKLWRQSREPAEIAAGVKKLRDNGAPWLADLLENTTAPKDKHVTNALPGLSWHQWGEAMDCYRSISGHANWEEKNYYDYANIAECDVIGLTAGGHWAKLKDWPHVQLRKADGPQNVYSYPTIDAKMKAMWDTSDIAPEISSMEKTAAHQYVAADLVSAVVSTLRAAAAEPFDEESHYFFPKGIFKIDVSVGILADAPNNEDGAAATPLLQARVSVSGIDKE
ncbi:glycoside hydrolase domain-containing protein [Rhizobium phaseoli]|uniref:glycoside hydrolase domain-containing protein n=1 Tax=Rhizobium phaseoli TaxID=396 RepID=UPI000BE9CFF8|nr:glycoside hydrolase domain-containing protein [Rhizobium phaseoli]PDS69871.1 hypothetical protein CO651_21900 [Rhizobium phaseoli]